MTVTAGPATTTGPRVDQVLPTLRPATALDPLLTVFSAAPTRRPFDPECLAFCSDLSRSLTRHTRHLPETQALAFWMRRAELTRLAAAFFRHSGENIVLVPRGTLLHMPPANVDTMFVYSWLLAVLTGNRNVVRLSSRSTDQSVALLDIIRDVLDAHPQIRDTTVMVRYEHRQSTTDALSAVCDLRVVWGGDAAVAAVRRSPLRPHAVDVTFPDRSSLATIKAAAYLSMTSSGRDDLVLAFYNDTYWFDQLGCSSPRAVVWIGAVGECAAAGEDFFGRLQGEIERKGYGVDAAGAIAKLGFSFAAMVDQPVSGYRVHSGALTTLSVDRFPIIRGEFCGGGTFFQFRSSRLLDLVDGIGHRDQTLTHHGFERQELRELVVALNGSGIDRVVPFGRALAFHHVWDGRDLLQAFTRRVTIESTD